MRTLARKAYDWEPTSQQKDIFGMIVDGDGHLMVNAGAGCGKSSTQLRAISMLSVDDRKRTVITAFNKEIADSLEGKTPRGVRFGTMHALGRRQLVKLCPDIKMEPRKSRIILNEICPGSIRQKARGMIAELASIVKNSSCSFLTWSEKQRLQGLERWRSYHGIPVPDEHLSYVVDLLNASLDDRERMDFDDMIWMPLALGKELEKYDRVVVDESQDLNPIQQLFVFNSVRETGRVIAVGDRNQSIYAFRGADADAIPNMIEFLDQRGGILQLPLTITQRCPKRVVNLANRIVPDFFAKQGARVGTIETAPLQVIEKRFALYGRDGISNMILARTNKPLVALLLRLWKQGIPARKVQDSTAGRIKKYIETLPASRRQMLDRAEADYGYELDKLVAIDATKRQIQNCHDKWGTIHLILEDCSSKEDALEIMTQMIRKRKNQVVLSTVHRAKGLEADHVAILEPWTIPHEMARKPWEKQQELNIAYVAATRAKQSLTFQDQIAPAFNQSGASLKHVLIG